jgi:hypothetical protein
MPNDPAASAIPWGLEMTGRAVLWVMDRASLSGGRDSLEGEAASALIFHPISKPTVNDYVPFFGVPAPLPTGHEILGKTEPTAQKFFGEKILENGICNSVNVARKPRRYRYLTKAWVGR